MPLSVPTSDEFAFARCKTCNYLLRQLENNVCPECGRAFDPKDRSTYYVQPRERSWRDDASPPPTWHLWVFLAAALLYIHGASFPLAPNFFLPCLLQIALVVSAPVILVLYLRRIIACYKLRSDDLPPPKDVARPRRNWFGLPCLIAAIITVNIYNWPYALRWSISKPAFDRVVKSILSGEPAPKTPCWIGAYRVKQIDALPDEGVIDFVTGQSFDACGVEYSLDGLRPNPMFQSFGLIPVELGNNWREFEW